MFKTSISIALLAFCSQAIAQNQYSVQIRKQANAMAQLVVKKSYADFPRYMIPGLLNIFGGKEKLIDVLKKGDEEMAAAGFHIKNTTIGEPGKVVDTANTLQCIVPETIIMTTPQGEMKRTTSLLAISYDKGANWTFADYNTGNAQELLAALPVISRKLKPMAGQTTTK